jgi:hypothetical protein
MSLMAGRWCRRVSPGRRASPPTASAPAPCAACTRPADRIPPVSICRCRQCVSAIDGTSSGTSRRSLSTAAPRTSKGLLGCWTTYESCASARVGCQAPAAQPDHAGASSGRVRRRRSRAARSVDARHCLTHRASIFAACNGVTGGPHGCDCWRTCPAVPASGCSGTRGSGRGLARDVCRQPPSHAIPA